MTQFEQAQEAVKAGKLNTPNVSMGTETGVKQIDYFGFQLATHHFNMKLMAKGMAFRGITFTQIKKYYGLKGRSAADCLEQFEAIMNKYKESLVKVNLN